MLPAPSDSTAVRRKWSFVSMLSFRAESERRVSALQALTRWKRIRDVRLAPWMFAIGAAVLTAVSGAWLHWSAELLFTWRYGFCVGRPFASAHTCCGHEVYPSERFACEVRAYEQEEDMLPDMLPGRRLSQTGSSSADGGDTLLPQGELRYWLSPFDEDAPSTTATRLLATLIAVLYAAATSMLVVKVAPQARGSGIPEIKTILGGHMLPGVLACPTVATKIIGLTLAVPAGLALGKEGPLVHVACCWAALLLHAAHRGHHNFLAKDAKNDEEAEVAAEAKGEPADKTIFQAEGSADRGAVSTDMRDEEIIVEAKQFTPNNMKTQKGSSSSSEVSPAETFPGGWPLFSEMLSAAAAAGVATAFGAPLGGVLFSFEEVSSHFPLKTMARAFFAASIAALTIQGLNGYNELAPYRIGEVPHWHFLTYFPFLLIGVLGGLVGAAFVHCSSLVTGFRLEMLRDSRTTRSLSSTAAAVAHKNSPVDALNKLPADQTISPHQHQMGSIPTKSTIADTASTLRTSTEDGGVVAAERGRITGKSQGEHMNRSPADLYVMNDKNTPDDPTPVKTSNTLRRRFFRWSFYPVCEVVAVTLFTCVLSDVVPLGQQKFLNPISTIVVHRMFSSCDAAGASRAGDGGHRLLSTVLGDRKLPANRMSKATEQGLHERNSIENAAATINTAPTTNFRGSAGLFWDRTREKYSLFPPMPAKTTLREATSPSSSDSRTASRGADVKARSLAESNLEIFDRLGLCSSTGQGFVISFELMATLLAAVLFRFAQTVVTFGAAIPGGLFVPALFTGSCLGRLLGTFFLYVAATDEERSRGVASADNMVHPGIYAQVGALAVLAGKCRVTVSLVVIMLELTGALELVVPFMVTALAARTVGNLLTSDGIYDRHITLKGYLFLHDFDFSRSPGRILTAGELLVQSRSREEQQENRQTFDGTSKLKATTEPEKVLKLNNINSCKDSFTNNGPLLSVGPSISSYQESNYFPDRHRVLELVGSESADGTVCDYSVYSVPPVSPFPNFGFRAGCAADVPEPKLEWMKLCREWADACVDTTAPRPELSRTQSEHSDEHGNDSQNFEHPVGTATVKLRQCSKDSTETGGGNDLSLALGGGSSTAESDAGGSASCSSSTVGSARIGGFSSEGAAGRIAMPRSSSVDNSRSSSRGFETEDGGGALIVPAAPNRNQHQHGRGGAPFSLEDGGHIFVRAAAAKAVLASCRGRQHFAVVHGMEPSNYQRRLLVGHVSRHALQAALDRKDDSSSHGIESKCSANPPVESASDAGRDSGSTSSETRKLRIPTKAIERNVVRMLPCTPISEVVALFRKLGLSHAAVVDEAGTFLGTLRKPTVIAYVEETKRAAEEEEARNGFAAVFGALFGDPGGQLGGTLLDEVRRPSVHSLGSLGENKGAFPMQRTKSSPPMRSTCELLPQVVPRNVSAISSSGVLSPARAGADDWHRARAGAPTPIMFKSPMISSV
ncbi:unnamed protein product [Amoebophrya sp. A25]|nr:unnamed protein product [Amoebophrya sp. A25]|eukprot:GSA25T00001911001.1